MTHPVLNPAPPMGVSVIQAKGRSLAAAHHKDDRIPWSPGIAAQFEKFAERVEIHFTYAIDDPLIAVMNRKPPPVSISDRWFAIFFKAMGSDRIQVDVDAKGIVISTRRKAEYVFGGWDRVQEQLGG